MTEKQNSDIPFYFKQQESDIFIVQFKNLEKVPFIQHFSEKLDSLFKDLFYDSICSTVRSNFRSNYLIKP